MSAEDSLIKKVYASNCEIYEVSVISNFLRKCVHLWKVDDNHQLCGFYEKHKEMSCMYCFFRSCCIRLETERKKGPKSLKLHEMIHQLFKFDKMGWIWRDNKQNIVEFILNIDY